MPVKILIADDHHVVADSLSMLLGSFESFEVVGIVNNGWQVLNFVEKCAVDIVLADLHMPLLNGNDMTARLREQHPLAKVIILTMSEEAVHIREALQAGVCGYVMKSADRAELIRAIQTVAEGENYFSEKIVRKLAEIPNLNNTNGKAAIDDTVPLTKRELEILRLIVEDLSNQAIADRLHLSVTTVETHRRNLLKKVGVSTAVGLMRWALKHKLIDEI